MEYKEEEMRGWGNGKIRGRDFVRLGCWGLIRQKATGGRSVDVSGLFAASRERAGRPTRVPSEHGMTRDGREGQPVTRWDGRAV